MSLVTKRDIPRNPLARLWFFMFRAYPSYPTRAEYEKGVRSMVWRTRK